MELTTFSIPTFRKATVQARLEKLARKATKYGNPDITIRFGATRLQTVKTEYGERDIEFIDVTVTGDAPVISGWQLLARVEITEGDENLIHAVPGSIVNLNEGYRVHDGHCDHCNTARRRNDVYVLTDGTEQMAVGRTCLRDFLGIDDPKGIVNRAQFFEEIRSIQDEDTVGGFSSAGYFDLHEVLLLTAGSIRKNGYVSKAKQAETGYSTTGECVAYCINGVPGYGIETNDNDKEWVAKTIGFFRMDISFGNDYMDNIRVLMKQDIVAQKHIGLIASSVVTAQRELAPKSEVVDSNFVGAEKQRLKGIELILEKIIYLGDSGWGSSYLHLMRDSAGNKFSWITGNKLEIDSGAAINMDATVKQHKIYNGTKQTVLTRAKILEKVN
jgi:hypothetical protein